MRSVFRLLLLLTLGSVLRAADSAPPKIAIQPLGKVKPDVVAETRESLERLYTVEVVILPAKELPSAAYYRPRDRYRAEKLLAWLAENTDAQFTKVIGLTESDISTTKDDIDDWGIFGLGELGQRPCVVSSFRLTRKVPRATMLTRLGKVAGHEVGHTFGLEHCAVDGCLMHEAGGKVATVDHEPGLLCTACRARVPAKAPTLP